MFFCRSASTGHHSSTNTLYYNTLFNAMELIKELLLSIIHNQGWALGYLETPSGLDFILLTELFIQPAISDCLLQNLILVSVPCILFTLCFVID